MAERRTITKLFAERYQRSTKKEKAELLDEYLKLTGYDRCYGAWLLRTHGKPVVPDPRRVAKGDVSLRLKRQSTPYYDKAVSPTPRPCLRPGAFADQAAALAR